MPTFIDESGDTGPFRNGGTPVFLLGAVWVPTLDVADLFRQSVRQLRDRNKLRANYEFKFSKTHAARIRRAEFFGTALAHKFQFAERDVEGERSPP